ncbi:hypothetical protein, partial [Gluconobacter japonicus]|uniref:hypothetical protein n=1 Tax=Gluconobacter japonicus TaxID=376620 RepID=UPI0039ED7265
GAAMTYLSHKASFHSRENTTPSNHGTKHLISQQSSVYRQDRMLIASISANLSHRLEKRKLLKAFFSNL